MDHFMNQGGDGIRNGTVQTFCAQVDLIKGTLALSILPDLLRGKMTVDLGAGLDGDNGLWKCIFKIFFVQNIKRILQEFRGLADGHGGYLLFVSDRKELAKIQRNGGRLPHTLRIVVILVPTGYRELQTCEPLRSRIASPERRSSGGNCAI